jgi:hypothetical protein
MPKINEQDLFYYHLLRAHSWKSQLFVFDTNEENINNSDFLHSDILDPNSNNYERFIKLFIMLVDTEILSNIAELFTYTTEDTNTTSNMFFTVQAIHNEICNRKCINYTMTVDEFDGCNLDIKETVVKCLQIMYNNKYMSKLINDKRMVRLTFEIFGLPKNHLEER